MSHKLPNPVLSDRFNRALVYASTKHREQARKSSDVPYVAHLLAVTSTVLEAGADEDTAIAALLHDVVEDQGGAVLFPEIKDQFGTKVRDIVEALSDSTSAPGERKADWRTRKEKYLASLAHHSREARLVSLADKLHNARSIVRDLKRQGTGAFDRFEGKQQGTLWYYSRLREIFSNTEPEFLSNEFSDVVTEMFARSAQPAGEKNV